jgi:hypothetical protein
MLSGCVLVIHRYAIEMICSSYNVVSGVLGRERSRYDFQRLFQPKLVRHLRPGAAG